MTKKLASHLVLGPRHCPTSGVVISIVTAALEHWIKLLEPVFERGGVALHPRNKIAVSKG